MLSVEIPLLQCGHGDTILLRLPGDKWALVDCHLPSGPIREHFFEFVRKHRIKRLDWVCLTHPHADHFTGMLQVVEHFTGQGKSIGTYCDSGVGPRQVRDILRAENRPESEVSDYEKLHRRLDRLVDEAMIRYYRVDENSSPICVQGYRGVALVPIGPDPAAVRKMTRDALRSGDVKGSVNKISLVLLLQVRSGKARFDALLAGDADTESLDRMFHRWAQRERGELRLDVVKVPHHGSAQSHSSRLCDARRGNGETVAAISAGTRRMLPDREVMREYMNSGWTVLATTTKLRDHHRTDSPLTLSGRFAVDTYSRQQQDIRIHWETLDELTWQPGEALVQAENLGLYESVVPT